MGIRRSDTEVVAGRSKERRVRGLIREIGDVGLLLVKKSLARNYKRHRGRTGGVQGDGRTHIRSLTGKRCFAGKGNASLTEIGLMPKRLREASSLTSSSFSS